ncbi:MAG: hypothetical protein V4651_14340 [Bacteroidota bacterium]
MKYKIALLLLMLANAGMVMAQNNSGNIYEIDTIRELNREELYQKYAYDDTSRALINKYYSSQTQSLVLAGVGSALTIGSGALTYVMVDAISKGSPLVIYLIPAIALSSAATIVFAVGTVSSVALAQSKTKLLASLKYYKEKGELTEKDRRWIHSYMPKR